MSNFRELIESELYTFQCQQFGGIDRLDEALRGVYWALARDPEIFDKVPGTKNLWIAKTRHLPQWGLPGFRIYYRIRHTSVELLAIEMIEEVD